MTNENLKPEAAGDENTQTVIDALKKSDAETSEGKGEKESNSSQKTDTLTTEKESRSSDKEKTENEEVDYKQKYADSTREFQEKYKPLEDKVRQFEELTGQSLVDSLQTLTENKEKDTTTEKQEIENQKKDTSKDSATDEVGEKLESLEKLVSSLTETVSKQEERAELTSKQKVEKFRDKYSLSDEEYVEKVQPQLEGVNHMRKSDGTPYTLEEGLELAYIIANKDKIDIIVERKVQQKQKEADLAFSPTGARDSSSIGEPEFSDQQITVAQRMGVDLKEEEK